MAEHPADPQQAAFSYPGSPERRGQRDTPFFSTPELRQRLDLLRHLTDNSEKILLVKGPQGAGKSTLLQHFREEAREDWDLCCLQASSQLQPDRLYALLFRRFGITNASEHGVDHLVRRFEMLAAAGHLPVLVIDDAEQLPPATVIAIFRLFERRPGTRALIRVVLFATPDIASLLRTPQLQAMNLQAVQSLELPRLSQDQSQAFVQFLLETMMPEARPQIGPGRLARLLKESGGLPGALEGGLRQLLARATPDTPEPEDQARPAPAGPGRLAVLKDLPVTVVAGGVALVALLLLALVFQDQINRLFEEGATGESRIQEQVSVEGLVRALPLPPQAPSRAELEAQPLPDQPELSATPPAESVSPPVSLPEITLEREVDAPRDAAESAGVVQPDQGDQSADRPKPVSSDAEDEVASEEMPEPETVEETGEQSGPAGEQELPSIAGEPANKPESASQEAQVPAGVESGVADVPSAGQADVVPRPEAAGVESQVGETGAGEAEQAATIKREDWLRRQAADHYTLQLVGVGSEQAALGFIRRHGLQGDVAYFRTVRAGKPWFSVLYGVFPNRDAAVRGRNRLPSSLKSQDAWPRTFASIHVLIKE